MEDKVKVIWDANAEFWDSRMGEGNDFHKTLIEPTQLKLLNIQPGQKILDLACGNGQFARKMAESGAAVTAVDFSSKFIAIAEAKGGFGIQYKVIDVTAESDLKKLEQETFDAVVCTMALMDVGDIEPLLTKLPKLLKIDGVFVFSILHPCFNSGDSSLVHERQDLNGEIENKYYVKISDYLVEKPRMGVGMAGQPRPQYYFHRPVSSILQCLFDRGFVLDAFLEPSFADSESTEGLFANVYRNIPPALVCRLRQTTRVID